MIGTSWIREQGMQDALLVDALRKRGMDDVPLWQRKFPKRDAAMKHWNDLTPRRDGPVNPEQVEVRDLAVMNEDIKRRAKEIGADDVGMTALRPTRATSDASFCGADPAACRCWIEGLSYDRGGKPLAWRVEMALTRPQVCKDGRVQREDSWMPLESPPNVPLHGFEIPVSVRRDA